MGNSIQLTSSELLDKIIDALNRKQPLSVVSVGYTESFVMAQYAILSENEIMDDPETIAANSNCSLDRGHFHRGLIFPNIQARDVTVEAVKKANIIGLNLNIPTAGNLTKRVFDYYKISPDYVFEAYIRRVIMFSQHSKFHQMLAGRKILIICNYADEVKKSLEKNLMKKIGFDVVGAIKIKQFTDLPRVKNEIDSYDFDLCLLAAGTNAVILGSYIANESGKVAFDLGQGMESLITGEIEGEYWLDEEIGLKKLMDM